MVVKYSAGLKTLLQYGNPGPVFYGDFVLAFKSIASRFFPVQFKTITKHYQK